MIHKRDESVARKRKPVKILFSIPIGIKGISSEFERDLRKIMLVIFYMFGLRYFWFEIFHIGDMVGKRNPKFFLSMSLTNGFLLYILIPIFM